jgi:hypothetical protein
LSGILLLTTACSTPAKQVFVQKAEVIANQLLDTMAEQRYADTVKFYDPRFFERITPAEWQTILKRLNERLGSYQSRKLTASSVQHGYSTISTATTVLVYHVFYEKNRTVQKFTFLSDEKAENMVLVGHYIDFPEENK